MPGLTWASHPNAQLRLRLADYLGRGWTIETLETDSAVVSRPKVWSRPARVLLNPFYAMYSTRKDRDDKVRLTLDAAGEVLEERL